MAVQKNLIQVNRNKVFAHIWGAAGDSSVILLTDLVAADETTSGTLRANIASAYLNSNDNGTSGVSVRRGVGGTIALDLHGASEYPGNSHLPALSFNNDSSIAVGFGVGGLLVLELHKVAGYVDPLYNKGV
jgi:hypothetical protein